MVFTLTKVDSEEIIIPNESIRIRVIANSNSINDQNIKGQVKNKIQDEIAIWLKDAKDVEEVRKILNDNLPNIDITVKQVLVQNDTSTEFKVNYGLNYFPEKKFKGIVYEEGYYESIVVTLGKGEGDNWWCVLFPPLCMMESNEENIKEVEYKSFIKEIIDKYF